MKFALLCLLVASPALAVNWADVRPLQRSLPVSRKPGNARIIGGGIASSGQFPYQVGLFLDGRGFCGGSLIKDDVVLTAGHCVDGVRSFEVHLGATKIFEEDEPGRVITSTTDSVLHEDYDSNTISADVGIVKLGIPIYGENIAVIRLPSRAQESLTFEGVPVRASGWGRVSDASSGISPDLKYVDVTVIGNTECEQAFPGYITEGNICIDTSGGESGVCNGDSGGPLTIKEADGMVTEVGIASFVSDDGCEADSPAGFTRVTIYLDWLEENAGVTIRP